MRKDIAEIRKRLESFDKKYEKDRTLSEKLEQYRRKYSALTQEDLQKQFTI
jgi:hypothetical protein